ncbi:MAG TPA: retropepsin-like aspartic protease [Gemmatimonadales bacterium]|jgi:hypothetical protein
MPSVIEVPLVGQPGRNATAMVDVMVNGHGPYHFLVETGARVIGIAGRLADSLRLPRIGGPDTDREFHIDSITLGGGAFHDMPAEALPFDFPGIDGVLGLPFYQGLLLTVDYPGHKVRLERDTLPAANGRDILALSRVADFWGIPINIGGKAFVGVLDTQNSGSIGIPVSVAGQLTFDGGLRAVGKARGAFGTIDVQGGQLSGNVVIGKYTIPTPFLTVTPLPPDYPNQPNIGTQVLDNFVVSLDQAHGRLRLLRSGPDTVTLPSPRRAGGG